MLNFTWNLTNSCTLDKTVVDSWKSKHGTSSQLQTTLWCIQANIPQLQCLFLAMFAIKYSTLTDTEMLSWFLYTQSKLRRIKSSIELCHLGYSLTDLMLFDCNTTVANSKMLKLCNIMVLTHTATSRIQVLTNQKELDIIHTFIPWLLRIWYSVFFAHMDSLSVNS